LEDFEEEICDLEIICIEARKILV